MGQLPILEFDGIVLCQSNTINRYLARKFGEQFKSIFNLFKPEFAIVIFIHYKPRIAVAILDL